jgi:general secretion pathway protein E
MLSAQLRPRREPASSHSDVETKTSSTAAEGWLEFAAFLARRHSITGDVIARLTPKHSNSEKKLRDLWQLTEFSSGVFADEIAGFYKLPRVDLRQLLAASPEVNQFSRRFLREMAVYPCRIDELGLTVVVADPTDAASIRAAKIVLRAPFAIAIGSYEDIATVLAEQLGEQGAVALTDSAVSHREDDVDSLRDLASGAPVVRAVSDLLEKAIELRATDIHIEPMRASLLVRLRVDGVLRSIPCPSNVLPQAMISRIKILAGLNIAERRLPQDGSAHLRVARSDVDVRVATMPTQHGESAVIRLLPKDRSVLEIPKLGLLDADQNKLKQLLKLPHGLVVVTGPTGSGKTTTLATMLTVLNDSTRKILTIEDPIEYEIQGINQSQVKPEIGLTFATALRAFVRQDPDVIMVGEIRDAETAHIAVHAALTGHLVLTTLHTETAAAAVPRLLDLKVEAFLLQSVLRGVVAQRLVRLLCERCKQQTRLSSAGLAADPRYAMIGFAAGDTVHEPGACERCSGTGYRGRSGLFEVLEVGDSVRELMGSRSDAGAIARAAVQTGMTTIFEHGVVKCRAGLTSATEVLRVATVC